MQTFTMRLRQWGGLLLKTIGVQGITTGTPVTLIRHHSGNAERCGFTQIQQSCAVVIADERLVTTRCC